MFFSVLKPAWCVVDLIFVVDESTSMERKENNIRNFIDNVVRNLPVSNTGAHVSLGMFNQYSREIFDLNDHTSVTSLRNAISRLSLNGGIGDINAGLTYAVNDAMSSAAGDRPNARNVVVIMTDDGTNNAGKLRALEDKLHQQSDDVIAIEIGHVDFAHLASDSRHEIHLRTADSLTNIVQTVRTLICKSTSSFP